VNLNNKSIFLVGPASVGKSTTAELLAKEIGYAFIDVDLHFCKRVGMIPEIVKNEGYAAYCEKNSRLVDELVKENPERTVFATPSGFLVHEDSPHLVAKHLNLISNGVSILLLPHEDPLKGVDTVVARQVHRWNDVDTEKERTRFFSRFEKYKNYGDIKIFSMEPPGRIIEMILKELAA
jgi:shikimate kinase